MNSLTDIENRLLRHGEAMRKYISSPVSAEALNNPNGLVNSSPSRYKGYSLGRRITAALIAAALLLALAVTAFAMGGNLQKYLSKITEWPGLADKPQLQSELLQTLGDDTACYFYSFETKSIQQPEEIGLKVQPLAVVSSRNTVYLYFTLTDISGAWHLEDTYSLKDQDGAQYLYYKNMELIPNFKLDGGNTGTGAADVVVLEYDKKAETALCRAFYSGENLIEKTIEAHIDINLNDSGCLTTIVLQAPITPSTTKVFTIDENAGNIRLNQLKASSMSLTIDGTFQEINGTDPHFTDEKEQAMNKMSKLSRQLEVLSSNATLFFKDGTRHTDLNSLTGLYGYDFEVKDNHFYATWFFKETIDTSLLQGVELNGAYRLC